MNARYCYWSVCDGDDLGQMRECVRSAREAGVFRPFHVFTTEAIEGAECYEPHGIEKDRRLFKLIYLRAGMTRLNFDYFVWLDPSTRFRHNPVNLLGALAKSPIHVPLTTNLSALSQPAPLPQEVCWPAGTPGNLDSPSAVTLLRPAEAHARFGDDIVAPTEAQSVAPERANTSHYVEWMTSAGVDNPVYWSSSAFWITHHDVIDRVCELAMHFMAWCRLRGMMVDVDVGLGWAMQMLCADPQRHTLNARPELWGECHGKDLESTSGPRPATDILALETWIIDPAIVHLPRGRIVANASGGRT